MASNDYINKLTQQNTTVGKPYGIVIKELRERVQENKEIQQLLLEGSDQSKDKIMYFIESIFKANAYRVEGMTHDEAMLKIKNSFFGWGPIETYISRDDVEEIQFDDYNDCYVTYGGLIHSVEECFESAEEFQLLTESLIQRATRQQKSLSNPTADNPIVRCRIGGNTRVTIIGGGLAVRPANCGLEGPVMQLVVRKQKAVNFTKQDLMNFGSISDYGYFLLELLIRYKVSVMGFGVTGSGKTAMLATIIRSAMPPTANTMTLAETDEMNLRTLDDRQFITKDGKQVRNPQFRKPLMRAKTWEITNKDVKILGLPAWSGAVNGTLTATPDSVICQETKGAEMVNLVESSVAGTQVITTIHVEDSANVPTRCLLMFQQSSAQISDHIVLGQVVEAFPIVVKFERFSDGSRKISEISEMVGFDPITKQLKLRPFMKYKVLRNYKDDNGKIKIIGKYEAIFPMEKSRLKNYMINKGMLEEEYLELVKLYEESRASDEDLQIYSRQYGISLY